MARVSVLVCLVLMMCLLQEGYSTHGMGSSFNLNGGRKRGENVSRNVRQVTSKILNIMFFF